MTRLYLGIDGGGTRCRARLVDADGRVLGEGQGGPSNPRLGLQSAMEEVLAATHEALRSAGLPREATALLSAGLGLAGVGQKAERGAVLAWDHPFSSTRVETDAHVACLGAHGGEDGAVLIVGTGSCGLALIGGQEVRIGGWGFPISDEGSGAWIGLEALRLALRVHDGLAPESSLAARVLAGFEEDPEAMVIWLGRARPRDYAALAPTVLEEAPRDEGAARIVKNAAVALAGLAEALLAAGAPRLSIMGGLAAPLMPYFPASLSGRLHPPKGDALEGALMLARGLGGSSPG